MNIIVKPYEGRLCQCRPDTTWERENKDFYSPDCVDELHWTPILFARISKAGKCIGRKFASRYYDAIGFGALLYCKVDGQMTACADHTSLLPFPMYNPVVLENKENIYEVTKNGECIFRTDATKGIEDAICEASVLTSLRIGDFVAVELGPAELLAERKEGTAAFKATFCENELYNLKLIF